MFLIVKLLRGQKSFFKNVENKVYFYTRIKYIYTYQPKKLIYRDVRALAIKFYDASARSRHINRIKIPWQINFFSPDYTGEDGVGTGRTTSPCVWYRELVFGTATPRRTIRTRSRTTTTTTRRISLTFWDDDDDDEKKREKNKNSFNWSRGVFIQTLLFQSSRSRGFS